MSQSQSSDQELCAAALQLPADQRRAFLEHVCGAAGERLRRVAAQLRPFELPENPPDDSTRTAPAMPPTLQALLAEKPGDRVGNYTLSQKLGEGGMGVVWKAEQSEPLHREVALKVIKASLDSNKVLARFAIERQALALMDHPNIAKVLEAGSTPTGRPFFVMEMVAGFSITDFCDRNRFSVRQRLELFVPVCQAIQHAHQKGIIHRDLKPSNVLVADYDGKPVPKVIDFGVAKAVEQPLNTETVFTEYGVVVGTLEYMSPEQADLDQPDVDTRSDIYSLGAMLYDLLTGTTPFARNDLRRSGLHGALRRIREEEPPKPSTRLGQSQDAMSISAHRKMEPPRLLRTVQGDLDWIVMKCLEKDRSRRYETANGLALDIQRYLSNEPILARPPSKIYRVQKLIRRNKLAFSLAGVALSALVAAGGFSAWQAVKARKAEHESSQVAKFLEEMLAGVGPSVARGRDTKMLQEILTTTAQRVAKDLKGEPEVELEIKDTIGEVYLELGDYTNSEAIFRDNLNLRRKLFGESHPETAKTMNNLGVVLLMQNKLPEAESYVRKALALQEKLFPGDHADTAASLNALGSVLFNEEKRGQAEDFLRQALAMRKRLYGKEHEDVAESLNDLSMVLKDENKLAEAEDTQRQALAMTRKLQGNDHPNVANSLNNLAEILSARGKLAEAESLHREELALSIKLLGNSHPGVATSLNNLALTLRAEKKLAEAETVARQALDIRKKGQDDASVAIAQSALACILVDEKKYEEAEPLNRRALELRQRSLAPDDPDLADSMQDLSVVLLAEGKITEAEQRMKDCLAFRQRVSPDDWQTFDAMSVLGGVLLQEKRFEEGEPLLLSGYSGIRARARKMTAEDQPRLARAAQRLAKLYTATDQPVKAAKWEKESEMSQRAAR